MIQNYSRKLSGLIATLAVLLLASCSSSKTVLPYFTDLTETDGMLTIVSGVPVIEPDDELFITVSSNPPEVTAQYNIPANNPASRSAIIGYTSPRQLTYIVDAEGNIDFPVLGRLHVAGMTVEALQKMLREKIEKDVRDPLVRVELVNFTVSVGGEVARPGVQAVHRNRYSLLDAISTAGDLTPYGERSNVLLIREENGKLNYHRLNLNSAEVFTSPYFYLKQNDYVYVEPNNIRQSNSRYNQDNAYKLQVTSTIVSAASVIASLVIALTVK